jgi:hypothetical protein
MARPLSAVTTFIRSLPADLSVADVIAQAKEKGFEPSEQKVARVRKMAGTTAAKKPAKPATDKTAAKATVPTAPTSETLPTSKPAAISKTDFIRNQPLGLSAASVVAMAKAQGITISESLVRLVRGPEGGKVRASAPRKTPAVKKVAKKNLAASKAPAAKPAPVSKSDFIRQQPASMSVADVIAKGKAGGMNIGRSLVCMVRGRSTAKKAGPEKVAPTRAVTKKTPAPGKPAPKKVATAPKPAPPKAAFPKTPATMSKADFIRHHPTLSAAEVVEKAMTEGMKLDANHVYTVRNYDKRAKAKMKAVAKRIAVKPTITPVVVKPVAEMKPANTKPAAMTPTTDAQVEDLLRAVAAELGLGRAVEILASERARMRAVIRAG